MNSPSKTSPPEEPVLESAPLAFRAAETLCRVDPITGESCAWYHGFRQYLRVLDLAITPAHHAGFLRDAFATIGHDDRPLRVLISGAIDYSMLAHALWAAGLNGTVVDATVVDVCETPLFLNRWYADRTGISIRTDRSDILSYDPGRAFDVICTNAFFGQFPPAQRPGLIKRWHALLAPGGKVFTVTPFRPGAGADRLGFTPQQSRELRDEVLKAARRRADALDLTAEELARLAEAFAGRMRVYPVRSLEEIGEMFGGAGFDMEWLAPAPIAADAHANLKGPTVSRSAQYAAVIARKP